MSDDELIEFARHKLEIRDSRAERARAMTQERSDRIRAGIRMAIADERLLDRPVAVGIVMRRLERAPERYGLRKAPDLELVRAVVREAQAARVTNLLPSSTLKPALLRTYPLHIAASPST